MKNARQRDLRARTKNRSTKRYEKTPRGFLMRTYRNMKSRVTGVQARKAHLYAGLPILPKDEFYTWAWDNPHFWRLYRQWVQADHDRRLTPSVNRIDPRKGYTRGNIEWLTHAVNSGLSRSAHRASLERVYALVS